MKKLRLYNENIQRIVVKMAEMCGTGYLFRRKVTKFKRNQNVCNIIENAIVPINSMNKTINVCKSILFLPHFYTDISINISSFCLKFYHKGFAFSIMLHTF